jgi:hypothetical protein
MVSSLFPDAVVLGAPVQARSRGRLKNLARVLVKATIRGPYKTTPSAKLRHEIHGIKKRSASTRPGASPIFPPPRRPR